MNTEIRGATVSCRANIHVESLPDDSAVLVDATSQVSYAVNAVGRRVWDLLDRNRPFQDLIENLVAQYDIDRGIAEEDLERFLHSLDDCGLISLHPPGGGR